MPAKDLKPVMVYLPHDTAAFYQQIADRESTSLSAVCRRLLVAEWIEAAEPKQKKR